MSEAIIRSTMKEVYDRIDQLPQVQAGHVRKDTIDRWVSSVMRTDPGRIMWHVARAAGIGGSDMASVMGVAHAYSSPGEVYGQKMLLIPPYRATAAMLRGAVIEDPIRTLFEGPQESPIELESDEQRKEELLPLIRGTFEAQIGRIRPGEQWIPRPDIEGLFGAPYDPSSSAPEWLVGNTDRIYQRGEFLDIVDFKAPSTETLKKMMKDETHFLKWDIQVLHYGLRGRYLGFEATGLHLAVFDYQNYGSRPFYLRSAEPNDEMYQQILDAGQHFWHDCLLRGINPEERLQVQVSAPPEIPENVEAVAQKVAQYAAIEKACDDLTSELKGQLELWAGGLDGQHALKLGNLPGQTEGIWNVTTQKNFNAGQALQRLLDLGLIAEDQMKNFRDKPGYLPSTDPAYQASIEDGLKAIQGVLTDLRNLPGTIAPAEVANMLEPILQAFRPMAKHGPYNEAMIRDSILLSGQPIHPFENTEVKIRRNTKKASTIAFEDMRTNAKATLVDFVERVLTPEQQMADVSFAEAPPEVVGASNVVPFVQPTVLGRAEDEQHVDQVTSNGTPKARRAALITANAPETTMDFN